jgi:hypothetical protein
MKRCFAVLALLPCIEACASSQPPPGPPARDGDPPIATVHARNCGRCHMRPEPKTRTRAQLESAFTRHRTRVHLSEDEWARLVDYLAQGDSR